MTPEKLQEGQSILSEIETLLLKKEALETTLEMMHKDTCESAAFSIGLFLFSAGYFEKCKVTTLPEEGIEIINFIINSIDRQIEVLRGKFSDLDI